MRPISTTLGWVKILNAVVCFFKEAISNAERVNTEIVDIVAKDIGKYIIAIINNRTTSGGIFSRNCLRDLLP